MNSAQMIQWRCRGCGLASPVGAAECGNCGTCRPGARQEHMRLLANALSNEGNGSVQNNVNNLAVNGDFHFGNYFSQSVEEDEEEETERENRRQERRYHSPLASFLMFTSGCAMWAAIITILGVVAFFVAIVVKAFFLH